jgi:hypothetical protein
MATFLKADNTDMQPAKQCVLLLLVWLQVAYKYGVDTHNILKESGADITFKTYNGMAHGVSC